MAIQGNLEHLPIVDIIQLMHSSRNTGILRVVGRKGESRLVFKGGYLVSANHLNNSLRIGQILIEQGLISAPDLERALFIQRNAAAQRKPLIMTLVEAGLVDEKGAYRALRSLIERTIVEILTWKTGMFYLEAKDEMTADEFRFYPEGLPHEIIIDTQGILMDALRVFDEKVRDGEIRLEEDAAAVAAAPAVAGTGSAAVAEETLDEAVLEEFSIDLGFDPKAGVTAMDLGLDVLDELEPRIPGVFRSLSDPAPLSSRTVATAPGSVLTEKMEELLAGLAGLRTAPEMAAALLRVVTSVFERALTIVVTRNELLLEKGIGLRAPKSEGPTAALGGRIPLADESLLREVVASGTLFSGPTDDRVIRTHLYPAIGAPRRPEILLLPVVRFGRTVFLTYADFGEREALAVPLEQLQRLLDRAVESLESAPPPRPAR